MAKFEKFFEGEFEENDIVGVYLYLLELRTLWCCLSSWSVLPCSSLQYILTTQNQIL
jgi:hypothetical protein